MSNLHTLADAAQREILRAALVRTAAAISPVVNLEALRHGFKSFAHPAFLPALEQMRLATKGDSDAFEYSWGVYAAVVLAGFGLPVAPYVSASNFKKVSNDIDTVLELFSANRGAVVGYNSCTAPFLPPLE